MRHAIFSQSYHAAGPHRRSHVVRNLPFCLSFGRKCSRLHNDDVWRPRISTFRAKLLAAEAQADFDVRDDPIKAPAYWEAWKAYTDALRKAGVYVTGAALQPPHTATMIRVRNGKRQVEDGPYAETKELLGGTAIIDVPNLDAALEWAARCTAASYASVDVRPAW